MSEQIKKIVQIDDPVLNNLVDTENKLNQLNQEVGVILNEYNNTNTPEVSFFNFNNSFFLLTLAGLFMLAFALWFLKQELKHSRPKKIKKQAKNSELAIKVIPKVANSLEQSRKEEKLVKKDKVNREGDLSQETKTEVNKVVKHKKVRKIQVIKIK